MVSTLPARQRNVAAAGTSPMLVVMLGRAEWPWLGVKKIKRLQFHEWRRGQPCEKRRAAGVVGTTITPALAVNV